MELGLSGLAAIGTQVLAYYLIGFGADFVAGEDLKVTFGTDW